MTYPVKWFNSNMQRAPRIDTPQAGKLADLLKACLVHGFGTRSISTLEWDPEQGCAKALIIDNHDYQLHSVVDVFGATPEAYNGEHRVTRVSDSHVWFELAGGNPGASGSGPMGMKVAGMGWEIAHESTSGDVFIIRPSTLAGKGNVALRVDNTAWAGWDGPDPAIYSMWFAKVQLVENVQGIDDYTLIYEHIWPAASKFSAVVRWDLICDEQAFYFMPSYGVYDRQMVFMFGYIKPVWPGDRYHAVLTHYEVMSPPPLSNYDWYSGLMTNGGTPLFSYGNSNQRVLARGSNQSFGVVPWTLHGLFSRPGMGLALPNMPDSGLYFSGSPLLVVEAGGNLRGFLPGVVAPYFSSQSLDRVNLAGVPSEGGNITRLLMLSYTSNIQSDPTLVGFDIVGPWR